MKFFHWNKQCLQEIEKLTQENATLSRANTTLRNDLAESKLKHEVALRGITINEKVADELRIQVAQLENELKKFKTNLLESVSDPIALSLTTTTISEEPKQSKKKRLEAK